MDSIGALPLRMFSPDRKKLNVDNPGLDTVGIFPRFEETEIAPPGGRGPGEHGLDSRGERRGCLEKATWDSRPEPSQLPIGVREDPDLVGIPSGSESSQIPTRSGLLTGGSLGDVPEGVTSGLSGPPVWPVRAQKAGFRGTRRQDGRAVTGPAAHA